MKKKMLFITGRYPYPIYNGDALRAYKQIEKLSDEYLIDVFSIEAQLKEEPTDFLSKINNKYICGATKKDKIFNILKDFSLSKPLQVSMYSNIEYKNKLKKILDLNHYDEVFIQLVRLSDYFEIIRDFSNDYNVTLDFVDALSFNMKQRSTSENILNKLLLRREAKLLENLEHKLIDNKNTFIAISQRDADIICSKNIKIIPNGVERVFYNRCMDNDIKNIIFFGNLSYYPNQKAVDFIVENIAPKVIGKYVFHIVGVNPTNKILNYNKYENIIVHGFIDDIEKFCENMDLAIFPMFYGSGLQNKVLESFAMGIPVIASENVACAINKWESTIAIANNANSFIEMINKLNVDINLRKSLVNNAKDLVENEYSWNTINNIF